MNSKAIIGIMVVAIVAIAGIAVISFGDSDDNKDKDNGSTDTKYVKDALGRDVPVPTDFKNGIMTIGSSGPLRFASLFDVYDDIIEVDKGDITDSRNGRGYSYAYDYYKMDADKQSHPDSNLDSATAERIGKKNPSLIITHVGTWNKAAENFEKLATRCTIVVLADQQMKYMTDENGKLADYFTFNVNLLGEILNKQDRAKEVINGVQKIIDDIKSVTGTSDKNVYVAGVTISGSNTLNTTFPTYIPFVLNGIKNAYNGGSTENKVTMLIESFTTMPMDMIVIDPSSSDKIKGNQDSQYVLEYLYRVNNDSDPNNNIPLYVTVPIVWDSINYDCALASAYYTAHLIYGKLTLEQVEEKINNVFTTFYGDHGKNVFKDMCDFFVEKSKTNGQEMAVLGEVVVKKNGNEYYLAAA